MFNMILQQNKMYIFTQVVIVRFRRIYWPRFKVLVFSF